MRPLLLPLVLVATGALAAPAPLPTHGISLEGLAATLPVSRFPVEVQRQRLEMAYVDLRPERETGAPIVLLHGKNFSAMYWEQTANALVAKGHRVVMPDQIGFGRSSKPATFAYSFEELARLTRQLLDGIGVEKPIVVGHSMGGMLAVRYSLMHPDGVARLALVNPIGLEDWRAKGAPAQSIDELYASELAKTRESLKEYQRVHYYGGEWVPPYDRWVDQLAGMLGSPEYPTMAWNQALTSQMIVTQPVVHELGRIPVPTLLIIGQRDRTAIGKDKAPPALRESLGDYPALGKAAAAAIPGAKLVELEGVGHSPHLEAFERFIAPLLEFVAAP
jgi:pimeloyl-ACP methyl ester carboxylesterase